MLGDSNVTNESRVGICLLPHLRIVDGMVVIRGVIECPAEALIHAGNLWAGDQYTADTG